MADTVDKETRSRMMAAIRGKNTKPEMALRKALHARGFRYRLHGKGIYGKPDLVLRKFNTVVFVHGCFWHQHSGCRYSSIPSSNRDFWLNKLNSNVARDQAVVHKLLESGWRIATVWECSLKTQNDVDISVEKLAEWLKSSTSVLEIPSSTSYLE
ncbi:MAG: DNA mismatch endonuclease Vsr [Rhodobacteraceae bacterium]|nr:DNA mismatch endonuclease Vsr [Paracoccaceae bacterium]MYF45070.1 DNA mismatch endonuclease Vsr [Paracoccaceae bacterium]